MIPLLPSSTTDTVAVASILQRTSTDGIKAPTLRANRSVRLSNNFEASNQRRKSTVEMSPTSVLPAADPTVYIQAGTSGNRHMYPIHLNDSNNGTFSRAISRLRTRTPKSSRSNSIDTIRNICSSIQTLQQLDLSDNTLEELPSDLCQLVQLEKLICANNRLTSLSNNFEQLKHLKELDLSYNMFKRIPAVIATYSKLMKLNLEDNAIKMVDVPFTNLRSLKTLVLDNNQIQSIDLIDFQQLPLLESLHIAHNQLTKFPRNLHRLNHLKIVNLSFNQLTSFPIELLLVNSLDALNLSHNQIRKLPPLTDVYKRKSLLFSIDLSHNQLMKFYDYLLIICRKLDLSYNQIQSIPSHALDKFTEEMLNERELKLFQNPLLNTNAPADLRTEMNNVLPFIHQYFHELHNTEMVRQGFRICITGSKNCGKSALTYALEENMPYIPDGDNDEKAERIVDVHQFAFAVEETAVKNCSTPVTRKVNEKRKTAKTPNPSNHSEETHRTLPVTIFDFNGSLTCFEHISPFLTSNAVHLICVHAVEFHQTAPKDIEDLFNGTISIDPTSMIGELLQLIQHVCEQATKTIPLMIIPVATCIDLFDKQVKQNKIQLLAKINQFFQLYLQKRHERLKEEITSIESRPIISASFSDRLKMLMAQLNTNIHIELCQPVSAVTFQGIAELHQTISKCVLTHKHLFPNVDRILPRLWADTNQYLESLADYLPVPYLSWDNYRHQLIEKDGLSNLVDEITDSLVDQGKILVLNELGTKERVVFLRPLWLGDLLSEIFCWQVTDQMELNADQRDLYEEGILKGSLLRSFWANLLHRDEHFHSLWFVLMRFLLFAYPKVNPRQLRTLFHSNEIKFDQAIVPYYLPMIEPKERDLAMKHLNPKTMTTVSVCYRSSMLPIGLFHQYSVLLLFRLPVIYDQHWNDFIHGHHDDRHVTFLIETDHRTYVKFHCGTNSLVQPFDQIWQLLLQFIHHFELLLHRLSPNHQYDRLVRCPHCLEFSFLGEWNTPKDLQNAKTKSCSSCSHPIESSFLIQPNESKRRNEEILRKIRERNPTPMQKKHLRDSQSVPSV